MNKNLSSRKQRKFKAQIPRARNSRRLIIGVLLIAALFAVSLSLPALVASSAGAAQLPNVSPHFNLDVAYFFVGQGPSANCTSSDGHLMYPESLYPSAVYFNVTRPTNPDNVSCDALIEVFIVKIASDKGPAENYVYFDGTNNNPSFSDAEKNALTVRIYDLFELSTIDGVSGNFCFNWTLGESLLSHKVGSYGVYTNYNYGLGLWRAGQPNTISLAVHRLGYVTMTNGVTSVVPDTTLTSITQVQLQNSGSGFLINNIVPSNRLSQTNLFQLTLLNP
jgi:hypothetical protein